MSEWQIDIVKENFSHYCENDRPFSDIISIERRPEAANEIKPGSVFQGGGG